MSLFSIRVFVPTKLSAVPVTILHCSVCVIKALYSSCHHTALQCVWKQGSLKFLSTYCIRLCVCQQGCLQFLSQNCIKLWVLTRLSVSPVTIRHYSVVLTKLSGFPFITLHESVCAIKSVCNSCHHTSLQCFWKQDCLQVLSKYCITVCVLTRLSAVSVTIIHESVCTK